MDGESRRRSVLVPIFIISKDIQSYEISPGMKTLLPFTREEGGLYNNKRITINFNYLYGRLTDDKDTAIPRCRQYQ
jgi:hypothetical protein